MTYQPRKCIQCWNRGDDCGAHTPGETLIFTRDGVRITEIDGNLSYIGTEDGMGYGPPTIDETLIAKTRKVEKRLAAAAERKARDEDGQFPDGDPIGWTIVRKVS